MRSTILLQITILFILLTQINARLLMNSKNYDTANTNNSNHNKESPRQSTRENVASLRKGEENNSKDNNNNTIEIILLVILPIVGLIFGLFIVVLWFRKQRLSKMILVQNTQNQLIQLKSTSSNSISKSFGVQNQSLEQCYPPNQQAPFFSLPQPQENQIPSENGHSLDLLKRNSFPSMSPQLLNLRDSASAPVQESLSSDQLNNKDNHNQLLKDEFGKNLLMQKLIIQMLLDKQEKNNQEIIKNSKNNSIAEVERQKVDIQDNKQLENNIFQSDKMIINIENNNIQINESTPTPSQSEQIQKIDVFNDPMNQKQDSQSIEENNNNLTIPPIKQQQFLENKENIDATFNQIQPAASRPRYQQLLNNLIKPDQNNNIARDITTDNGTQEMLGPASLLCTECKQNQLSSIFSCGHMACSDCSDKLTTHCPFCSLPILSKKPIFFS